MLGEARSFRILREVIRCQLLLGELVVRLLQDVGELVGGAEVVGAVPDLVGVVGLVAEVGTRLQDVLTLLEDSCSCRNGAIRVLNAGSVPPRLLPMSLRRRALVLAAQSQLYHVPQTMILANGLRVHREFIFVELNLVLVADPPLHRSVSRLDEANRHLLLARVPARLDDLGLLTR